MKSIKKVQHQKTDTTDQNVQTHVHERQINILNNAAGRIQSFLIEVRIKEFKTDYNRVNWDGYEHQEGLSEFIHAAKIRFPSEKKRLIGQSRQVLRVYTSCGDSA